MRQTKRIIKRKNRKYNSSKKTRGHSGGGIIDNIGANMLKAVSTGYDALAAQVGMDPNATSDEELQKLRDKTNKLTEIITSPELEQIRNDIVDVATPMVKKSIDTIVPQVGPIIMQAKDAALNSISAIPIPLVSTLISVPRIIDNVGDITQRVVKMSDDLTKMGDDTLDTIKGQIQSRTNLSRQSFARFSRPTNKPVAF